MSQNWREVFGVCFKELPARISVVADNLDNLDEATTVKTHVSLVRKKDLAL